MKKLIYNLLLCFSLLCTAFCASSCVMSSSDDDEHYGNEISDVTFLIGTWHECDENGNLLNIYTEAEANRLTFYTGNRAMLEVFSKGSQTKKQDYSFRCEGSYESGGIFLTPDNDDVEYGQPFTLKGNILTYGSIHYKKQ